MPSKKRKVSIDDDGSNKHDRHSAVLEKKNKSLQLAANRARKHKDDEPAETEPAEPAEVHDLKPLPQPKLTDSKAPAPSYDGRPEWLSKPTILPYDHRKPFSELNLDDRAVSRLKHQGFSEAYAVQAAVIPQLLPTAKRRSGDVLVRAATGSGKTLAYAVPIVRDVGWGGVTRLRALVVLPTRELVKQAKAVFEQVSQVYEGEGKRKVKIGMALGSQELAAERKTLIRPEKRYDPEAYQKVKEEEAANRDPLDLFAEPDPRLGPFKNEIITFWSNVDVLICTPGRLIEHIEKTPDWLDYVRWLVIDEADKIFSQSYQDWLSVLMKELSVMKFTRREFPDFDYEGPRKIILSATMTPELDVLEKLKLHRPKLIVIDEERADQTVGQYSLPPTLEEYAIRVHDVHLRPLYLLDLLRNHIEESTESNEAVEESSDATSDTSPDDSSDTSDSDTSDSDSEEEKNTLKPKSKQKQKPKPGGKWKPPICLIFTSSNEAALRLARLLAILDEDLAPYIDTITSLTRTYIRTKTLKAFTTEKSPIRLLIASDLVSRGIDLPNLEYVINYDLPWKAESYVHRVGRTARAGRHGKAFTLVGDHPSEGWIWGKVFKNPAVWRPQPVGRLLLDRQDEKAEMFEKALTTLGEEAEK